MMHVPFEAVAWVHFAHRNADWVLFASLATLGLLPLVSIYLIETEKLDSVSSMEVSHVVRTCLRTLIYVAILFPYLLALLSTYISIQLIRHPGFQKTETTRPWAKAAAFWKFYQNTKVLKKQDEVFQKDETTPLWKVTSPTNRLVEGECVICMHSYRVGDRIVWSSNPQCIHCYHSDCLQAWMEPAWDARSKRCPCCRQSFFK